MSFEEKFFKVAVCLFPLSGVLLLAQAPPTTYSSLHVVFNPTFMLSSFAFMVVAAVVIDIVGGAKARYVANFFLIGYPVGAMIAVMTATDEDIAAFFGVTTLGMEWLTVILRVMIGVVAFAVYCVPFILTTVIRSFITTATGKKG